jgi:NNP family nitrate/nitrite transporter-like MFS transporter
MRQRTGSRWLERWEPEDEAFWNGGGRAIAWRNLVWSIVAENVGFSVWLLWSVVAMKLPKVGFHYSTEQLFQLVALPGLVGCLMRFPYTFAVPRFGGRNWTIVSALLLLIPTVSLAILVGRPDTPFWLMATAAATAGLGGGNFASSMANISFFFPDRDKGFALGLNAAGGNIGVSTVQLLVPLVVGAGARLAFAGWMWLPLIGLAALGAHAKMNNLTSARSSFSDQIAMARRKHTWVISWLYIGTFGSFVGYSAAFPLLLKTQFPEAAIGLAFLGPLVGSVARPLGGKMADRFGGAPVTFANFLVMTAATLGVVHALGVHSFPEFLATFLALFVTTGIGNGSTFRMIPAIFRAEALARRTGEDTAAALDRGRRDTAAVLGLCSAIGAVGGYLIPQAFSTSIRAGSGAAGALTVFVAFYATCLAMTWWHYLRANGLASRARSFATVKV